MWERFKMDFKERFLNFETAKGIYMVPAGLVIVYCAIYYIAFVIQVAFAVFGWYMVSDGLRKIWVNRIKQAVKTEQMKEDRIERTEGRL